ncbi:septum site-determining protein MinC [Oceanotoga sp. DSM 15011]|jgi:septum site-determining protein MinC|uniref:Probable septum site-determining protein MinC n=1 Tax=Oceanotoga teriensis TaxID=515440 RepID=A0AA45C954_9BACT|nr:MULTISPECIES: septum site-determining protein MinC [Oceanotoga]MDN5341598.1 septum site-determining protein MinC [Oceanotoga sp.]MDO7977198.1 septum site-determining protein MinC [Oceanotoga teriensis]PWJ96530.1 septum site-determining protein MinC [Oceanotoga teriensis]UYP00295.1 septum site-determining protein MinC [Oceanotoga sp. DSM 15011]
MDDFIYAKIIDGDIIFFFEEGCTQKELFEQFQKKLNMMKNFFKMGDSFYIYLKDDTQYNLLPKVAKFASTLNLQLAGAYFGDLPSVKKSKKELNLSSTKIFRKHVRSGQVIENPGDIIIFGNINKGAEVNAGGSVIVFGKVAGIIRAGLSNKRNVFIIASQMESSLIEIAEIPLFNYQWPETPVSIRTTGDEALVEQLEI